MSCVAAWPCSLFPPVSLVEAEVFPPKTSLVLIPAGRLEHLDRLSWEELQVQLAIGLLAGNVFDWGAKEVALLMEESSLV